MLITRWNNIHLISICRSSQVSCTRVNCCAAFIFTLYKHAVYVGQWIFKFSIRRKLLLSVCKCWLGFVLLCVRLFPVQTIANNFLVDTWGYCFATRKNLGCVLWLRICGLKIEHMQKIRKIAWSLNEISKKKESHLHSSCQVHWSVFN